MNRNLEIRKSTVFNKEFLWPKNDKGCWEHLQKSKYAFIPKQIAECVANKELVIQAGGNCGIYPMQYANLFQKVITFEPDYINFMCLTYNVQQKNVYKYQALLGNSNEPLSMIPTDNVGSFKTLGNKGSIPQLRIDDFGLSPSLIHLDIEGYERYALEGATETILKNKPVIVIESKRTKEEKKFSNNLMKSFNYIYVKNIGKDRLYLHESIK